MTNLFGTAGAAGVGKSVKAFDIQTNYHEAGIGDVVILLHGSGPGVSAWTNWRRVMPALSTRFRVLAPDMAGFGYTERRDDLTYDIKLWMKQLIGFMDALEIKTAHLEVWLVQKGERFYLPNLSRAHDRFTEDCRSLGLTAGDYPLNHDEGGRRSLRTALRLRILDGFAEAHRAAGGEGVKPAAALGFGPGRAVTDPFDTVEFHSHKLDPRLKILDEDPEGEENVKEIERVWLFALIDVGSRAILGYTLCLRREYSRYYVIRIFEKALTPAMAPITTIADLEPLRGGGFVSTILPETAYACWCTLRFDNARAHLAADSMDVACELLGFTVDAGPPYEPNDRPFIERFFGTVASRLIHRLPGTTGSSSDDILRKLRDVRGDLRLIVSLDELKELLAVWVWNYNGTPHGGLPGGRTPLEIIERAVRERQLLLRHVPPELRGNLCCCRACTCRACEGTWSGATSRTSAATTSAIPIISSPSRPT